MKTDAIRAALDDVGEEEGLAQLLALETENAEWRSLVGSIIRNEISREEFIEGSRSLELAPSTPTDKVLVDLEELLEACTNIEMAPAGANEVYYCLLCKQHSLSRGTINHTADCWLDNKLKEAS